MYKNAQANPKKFKNLTQHSCCSMLTREKNMKAIRGNGYCFVPKGGTFPTKNNHACCEKYIPKPAPYGTKFVPRHVDAAP